MSDISKRLKEIDEELSNLYREKHYLERKQQEEWQKNYGSLSNIATNEQIICY